MRLTVRQLFPIVLLIGLFAMTLRPVADADFWWHLRTGQLIVETRSIPHSDPFSFTSQGKEWVAHEWLSEVILYGLYHVGGFGLLIITFSLIITAAFALLYFSSPGKPYLAGFAVFLGFLASAPILGVRPQMFTLLFSSIYLYLLERFRRNGSLRALIPLPILMILWVNLHSGYAVGLTIIMLFILGESAEIIFPQLARDTRDEAANMKRAKYLAGVLLLCAAAVLVNPNGARMYTYPFETLGSSAMQSYIQEWFSPDFHFLRWQPFALLIVVTLGAALLARGPVPVSYILLSVFFCYASLRSARNIPFFVLSAVPLLGAQAQVLFEKRVPAAQPTTAPPKVLLSILNIFLVILLAGAALFRFTTVVRQQAETESTSFPERAVLWIKLGKPQANLYNTYDWGGYLIWQLYPQYQVFIDGRADVHGDQFIEDFLSIYRAEPGWEASLSKFNVNTVLIQRASPLAIALARSGDWTLQYEDSLAAIYTRK